jgi:hypothetical protein
VVFTPGGNSLFLNFLVFNDNFFKKRWVYLLKFPFQRLWCDTNWDVCSPLSSHLFRHLTDLHQNKALLLTHTRHYFWKVPPPPPLSKARLGAKIFKKNGGPIRGCPLDKVRLGHHFSFILPINRKRRCKKMAVRSGVRLGQGGPLGRGGGRYPKKNQKKHYLFR